MVNAFEFRVSRDMTRPGHFNRQTLILSPKILPNSANTNHIQPCKLPEAMPLKNAPILQPEAITAPKPIMTPPRMLINKRMRVAFILARGWIIETMSAPNMTPKVVKLTGFVKSV